MLAQRSVVVFQNFKKVNFKKRKISNKYNEKRTPAYHNLFLRYEYRKVYKNWNLISYVEFWNAYNRRNIETYSWSNSAQKIIETTYFSFIPVGGFEIEF